MVQLTMRWLLASVALWAMPAMAQDLKPLCPDRGAIQPCIVDEGRVQIEVSAVDWFDDSDSTLLLGDSVVRIGLDDRTEVQVGWSPHIRKGSLNGHGDVRLALRRNIRDDRLSLAIQPMINLPLGTPGMSSGRVEGGMALAGTFDLTSTTQFYASPTIFFAPQPIVSGALGVNQTVHGPIGVSVEVYALKSPTETQASLDFTTTWTATDNMEFDFSANIGMTRQTPALELVIGVSHRF